MIDQIEVSQHDLQPIRFQGQHFDEKTGLHYNRFRYYDADMGMFTSRDPIGLMGGYILGIGCNDDHFQCTSATYKDEKGNENTVTYSDYSESRAVPTGALWPPTPSYVEEQGGKCNEVIGRPGSNYIVK